jgi:hypothetical protein
MSELLKPPAVPAAILNFFASQPDFPAVAGDISEEFHQRAQSSGAEAAHRWYWREAFRNALALTWRELARTPVRTMLVAIGCLVGVSAVMALYGFLRFYPLQPDALETVVRHGNVLIALYLIASLAMGWIGGRLLRGREWALALTFTFVSACVTLPGTWYLVFVYKVDLSTPLWAIAILGNVLRQGAFWLGCLWIRVIRLHSRSFAAITTTADNSQSSAPRNPPDPC